MQPFRAPHLFDMAWLGLAMAACLAIWPLNGAPLSYFDTAGYFAQGAASADALGLTQTAGQTGAGASRPADPSPESKDRIVIGSRSATYALALTLFSRAFGVGSVGIVQSLLLIVSLWLGLRAAARSVTAPPAALRVTTFAILAACLGSAPFYTIYLMPDIFTPILILSISALAVFSGRMRLWEIVLATALGAWSITTHPSHIPILGAMFVAVVLVALVLRPQRRWLGVALVAIIGLSGLAERVAFTTVVETVQKAEVVYQPFLTVRLIVDGPGLARLAEVCPDRPFATCALYDQLADRPERIDASRIMFDPSEETGSFARLDPAVQKSIADEQSRFVANVVKSHPLDVAFAVLGNTTEQLMTSSIIMTLPAANTLERMRRMTDELPPAVLQSRLTEHPAWLDAVEAWHRLWYGISAAGVAVLLLMPRRGPPASLRIFVGLVLTGIFVNALVCGGISQPAERYGARVIFLLPLSLVVLIAFLPGWQSVRWRKI